MTATEFLDNLFPLWRTAPIDVVNEILDHYGLVVVYYEQQERLVTSRLRLTTKTWGTDLRTRALPEEVEADDPTPGGSSDLCDGRARIIASSRNNSNPEILR